MDGVVLNIKLQEIQKNQEALFTLLNRIRRVQKIRDVSSIANVHVELSKAYEEFRCSDIFFKDGKDSMT